MKMKDMTAPAVGASAGVESQRAPRTIPRIISVDDHVVEPPDVWTARVPSRFRDRAPHVRRQRLRQAVEFKGVGSSVDVALGNGWIESNDGEWADVWHFEGILKPLLKGHCVVGDPSEGDEPTQGICVTTFDEMHKGGWDRTARLGDMDANHVEASVCFPGVLPRFCGQTFHEQPDRDLGLVCVRAYNDWMIDEWCAGPARGRLIPLTLVPLWDPSLAAEEVRRCSAKGSHAVSFSENPHALGLPSLSDPARSWDPFWQACNETESIVLMHFGSSSKMPIVTPDSPSIVGSCLTFQNAMGSMLEMIFAGTMERFPNLKISYAECQAGWLPFLLERADKKWLQKQNDVFEFHLPRPPSSYVPGRIFSSIIDDETGLLLRDEIGIDQICFETDYPHPDSTFPFSRELITRLVTNACLRDDEIYKVVRGNAISAFGLHRFGIVS